MADHDLVPTQYRARAYRVYAIVGLALGGVQVGYSAAESGQPTWLTVALAVFAFVGTGLGLTAAAYTPTDPGDDYEARHAE